VDIKNVKNIVYPLVGYTILSASLTLNAKCIAANQMDVNLNGGANFNINNANNNKMTTPLKNFSPVPLPPGQIDLLPIATPPVTSTVTNVFGGWRNIDIVDPGYTNASEAKAVHQREGTYVGKAPQVDDDKPVSATDIDNFLDSYHGYLKDVGVESGFNYGSQSPPRQPIKKESEVKKTSALPQENKPSVELLASQQKLSIDSPQATSLERKPLSH
jgi:hypothetical protein